MLCSHISSVVTPPPRCFLSGYFFYHSLSGSGSRCLLLNFQPPCWAPCCDPLLNILYHLNLPAVIPQTAEVLPHESTETSGYTSMPCISYVCVLHWSMCLLFVFVILQRTICWLLECAYRVCFWLFLLDGLEIPKKLNKIYIFKVYFSLVIFNKLFCQLNTF